jgi:hypothetical protein
MSLGNLGMRPLVYLSPRREQRHARHLGRCRGLVPSRWKTGFRADLSLRLEVFRALFWIDAFFDRGRKRPHGQVSHKSYLYYGPHRRFNKYWPAPPH